MNRTGSKPGRTLNRPTTRFLCRWRPRRKVDRVFSKRDAARVICYALRRFGAAQRETVSDESAVITVSPTTIGAIVAEARSICPELAKDPTFDVENRLTAESSMAISALEENNQVLEQLLKILAAMNAALAAILFLSNLTPLRVVIRPVAIAVQSAIRGFQGTVIARKAANDSVIDTFRQIREAQTRLAA